jgi:hypothetical protein
MNFQKENKLKVLKTIGYISAFVLMFYVLIAYAVWGTRHPKANEFTFYTYFFDVMTFQEVEELK